MRLVKIGVGAVSVKVGDFAGNAARIRAVIGEARSQGVDLLVTPELAVSGYSLKDRVWWPDIARRSWETLQRLAADCDGMSVFAGLPLNMNARIYNGAALIHDGRILGVILKKNLPSHSVFYEGRNYTAWMGTDYDHYYGVPAGDMIFSLPYGRVSAEICEDLWAPVSPAQARTAAGAEIICNLSGSPFTPRKNEARKRLVLSAASRYACVYAFSNLLGLDNSRLVFDGGGIVATPEKIVCEGPILAKEHWTLATATVDLDAIARERAENAAWRKKGDENGGPRVVPLPQDVTDGSKTFRASHNPGAATAAKHDARDESRADGHGRFEEFAAQMPKSFFLPDPPPQRDEVAAYFDELFDGLVLGLRDYFEKVGAFERFLIALSGGRDSALCLLIAVYAAKLFNEGKDAAKYRDRVSSVYLPYTPYSSAETEEASRALAAELDVPFQVLPIDDEVKVALQQAAKIAGGEDKVTDLAKQNLQARIRGATMLNWSNNVGGLLLVTSNLSEAAVGYSTTGGDNEGGFSPVANLPKTVITRLLAHLAEREGLQSLEKVLAIPPSAELAKDQLDEEDLMPYIILDDLLYLFGHRRLALANCWRILCYRHEDFDREKLREFTARFGKMFAQSQWKREQLPVALRVMELDLDPKTGFRFPVTQSIQDELDELGSATL